jgi:hypothetical protein
MRVLLKTSAPLITCGCCEKTSGNLLLPVMFQQCFRLTLKSKSKSEFAWTLIFLLRSWKFA